MDKIFYGLWVSKHEDVDTILKTGIWKNKLSNKDRIEQQISSLNTNDEVFLFQGYEDVKVSSSPFANILPKNYQYFDSTVVHVRGLSIGKVIETNLIDSTVKVDWNQSYNGSEWYLYFRQDGIWRFDNIPNQTKKQLLYDIVFNGKKQDYEWWANNGGFTRYKKEEENKLLKDKNMNIKNIILYGAPGVGKTHNYQNLISMIEDNKNQKEIFGAITNNLHVELDNDIFTKVKEEKRVEFITFHQSYSYEDFIEGFRPNENTKIKLENGIFKNIAEKAYDNKEQNFYIVIDEINRGNISKIFGELITLIEEDKRDTYEVTLPYSKKAFKIPSNLYIIATMNSTDKSIATIDIALRRRFTFLKMKPNLDLVEYPKAKEVMKKLNEYIVANLSEDYQLGHSYFMQVQDDEDLEFVKEYKIKPLLEEYFYADEKSADEIMSEVLKNG